MIRKAILEDVNEILKITKACAVHMISNNIFQWNELYPSKKVLLNDINLKQIWKLVENDEIIGIIVLTEIEDLEYKNVQWLTKNGNNLYIHRLAVHPKFHGKGYAQKLMDFAENYAKLKSYTSSRLDTFSQNKRNQQFYEKRNYVRLESIYLLNQSEFPFYCYELVLNE